MLILRGNGGMVFFLWGLPILRRSVITSIIKKSITKPERSKKNTGDFLKNTGLNMMNGMCGID